MWTKDVSTSKRKLSFMGNLKPPTEKEVKFSQLYIVDIENEIDDITFVIRYYTRVDMDFMVL